jgi:hypothetical protein
MSARLRNDGISRLSMVGSDEEGDAMTLFKDDSAAEGGKS